MICVQNYATKVVVADDEMEVGLRALQRNALAVAKGVDELLGLNAQRREYRTALQGELGAQRARRDGSKSAAAGGTAAA